MKSKFPETTIDAIRAWPEGYPKGVMLTLELAKQLIALRGSNYRNLRKGWIALYAHEMTIGKWGMNYSENITIVRDEKGQLHLMNGQHRVSAVLESGVACPFLLVLVDICDYEDKIIDVGKRRSAMDDFDHDFGIVDKRATSVARQLLIEQGISAAQITREMATQSYLQYKDAIHTMMEFAPRNQRGWRVTLHSVITRATIRYEDEIISEFCRKLSEMEFVGPKDDGVKYVHLAMQMGATPRGLPKDYGRRCESGFYYFAEGKAGFSRKRSRSGAHIHAVSECGYHLPLPPFHYPGVKIGNRGTREKAKTRRSGLLGDITGVMRSTPRMPLLCGEIAEVLGHSDSKKVMESINSAARQGRLPDDIVILDKGNRYWYVCDPL